MSLKVLPDGCAKGRLAEGLMARRIAGGAHAAEIKALFSPCLG
jgi:hypothetical protein